MDDIIRIECPADRPHRIRDGDYVGEVAECKRLLIMTHSRNHIIGQYIKCPKCGSMIYITQSEDDGIKLQIREKTERIVCKQTVKVIE
jgi:hypothetical protein